MRRMLSPCLTCLIACAVLAVALLTYPIRSSLAQTGHSRHDVEFLRGAAEQFLRTQTAGLPGSVAITVGQLDSRLSLPACESIEPFIPTGGRLWGKTTVGVRCATPSAWTVFLQATVKVTGEYVATRAPLAQGQTIGANDVALVTGDLSALPPGIVTSLSQAVGRTAGIAIPSGLPLRADALRNFPSVQQGQSVRLVSSGPGFQVSAEGKAVTTGMDGQIVQARTPSGQLVSGVAKPGGVVEVAY